MGKISVVCMASKEVHRIWGIWGSYSEIPKATFYLLKGDYVSMLANFSDLPRSV